MITSAYLFKNFGAVYGIRAGVVAAQTLRVPLNAKNGQTFVLEGFHIGILREGIRHKVLTQFLDRLVVEAVDEKAFSVKLAHQSFRFSRYRMDKIFFGSASVNGRFRHVLVQRAAKVHVEDLMSTADAQDRFSGFHKYLDKLQFRSIPLLADSLGSGIFFLAAFT